MTKKKPPLPSFVLSAAPLPPERAPTCWPTQQRLARGGILVEDNVARAQDPLRIDRLRANGVIDEMQHLYGLQLITLWTLARRPFIKVMQYEPRSGSRSFDATYLMLNRMSAEDQLFKIMHALRPREQALLAKICFEELPALEAGRALGLPVNSITSYVRAAFDDLGEALIQMRRAKKALEEQRENTIGG